MPARGGASGQGLSLCVHLRAWFAAVFVAADVSPGSWSVHLSSVSLPGMSSICMNARLHTSERVCGLRGADEQMRGGCQGYSVEGGMDQNHHLLLLSGCSGAGPAESETCES